MAQTTGAISSKDYKIETSPDGSAWTDRSGNAMKLSESGGERMTGTAHTFDGDVPIVTAGKRAEKTFNVEFVYSEGASDLFEVVRASYEAGSAFYVRYSPKGGQTNEFLYTSDAGYVTNVQNPPGDASNGDPVVCSFDFITPKFTKSAA
jgi:hypothetical protein